jgi:hypothetical protein
MRFNRLVISLAGSNWAIKASDFITTLMYMFIDRAVHSEDVNHLHSDEAYQEMLK